MKETEYSADAGVRPTVHMRMKGRVALYVGGWTLSLTEVKAGSESSPIGVEEMRVTNVSKRNPNTAKFN